MTKDDASESKHGKHRRVSSAGPNRRHCTLENLEVKLEGDGLLSAEEW